MQLENFASKQIISNWNRLDIDLKATGDIEDFQYMLNGKILASYKHEIDCPYIKKIHMVEAYHS